MNTKDKIYDPVDNLHIKCWRRNILYWWKVANIAVEPNLIPGSMLFSLSLCVSPCFTMILNHTPYLFPPISPCQFFHYLHSASSFHHWQMKCFAAFPSVARKRREEREIVGNHSHWNNPFCIVESWTACELLLYHFLRFFFYVSVRERKWQYCVQYKSRDLVLIPCSTCTPCLVYTSHRRKTA